jgi:hypothetical protein
MDGATRPLAGGAYATSARRLRRRSKPKSRSSLRSASRSTTAVPQAIAGMRQKRIRGCEIPPHRRRHQWPDAMPRRHSLLNLRSVDPGDGSFKSSHGHSLLRSSAHNIKSEAVVIESDPNAKSRATREPAGLRQIKRSFHGGHSLMHGASLSIRKKPCARVGLDRRAAARLGWGARKKRA